MATFFFISLSIIGVSIVLTFVNLMVGFNRMQNNIESFGTTATLHMICMLGYLVGVLGSVGFGLAWLIQAISDK